MKKYIVYKKLCDTKRIVLEWILRITVLNFMVFGSYYSANDLVVIVFLVTIGFVLLRKYSKITFFLLSSKGLIKRELFFGMFIRDEMIQYESIENISMKEELGCVVMMNHFISDRPNKLKIKFSNGVVNEYNMLITKERLSYFVRSGNKLIQKKVTCNHKMVLLDDCFV